MIDEGLFERFPVDAVYGMHNTPGLPVGEFATRKGPFMAASDAWTVDVPRQRRPWRRRRASGDRSDPGGRPVYRRIQTIVSRNVPATEVGVVSVGHIAAGHRDAPNIIPAEAVVSGTARSYAPAIQDLIETRLRAIAAACAAAFGCSAEIDYRRLFPPLVTHPAETDVALAAARALVGARAVADEAPLLTGSEDFAFMLEAKPGSFIMIGNGVEPDGTVPLRPHAGIRLQRRDPDARRRLLGQPRRRRVG